MIRRWSANYQSQAYPDSHRQPQPVLHLIRQKFGEQANQLALLGCKQRMGGHNLKWVETIELLTKDIYQSPDRRVMEHCH